MMTEVCMVAIGAVLGTAAVWRWTLDARRTTLCKGELPEIEPMAEEDLLRVGLMSEHDAAVRAPLHVAEAMRQAKRISVGDGLELVVPGSERVEQAVWMAAGYLSACREFERLWLKMREDARKARRES